MTDPQAPLPFPGPARPPRTDGGPIIPLGIALLLAGIYALADDGARLPIDASMMLGTTQEWLAGNWRDPAALSKYGPMVSILLIPIELLRRMLGGMITESQAVCLLSNGATSAAAAVLYLTARRLGYRAARSVAVALVFGLATYALPFTRSPQSEPLQSLLVMLILHGLVVTRTSGGRGGAVRIALCLAPLTLTKFYAMALLGPPLLAGAFLTERARGELGAGRAGRARLMIMFCGATVALALQMLVNLAVRDSLFRFGYVLDRDIRGFTTPLYEGLFGLTVGMTKGFWYYSPVLALALFTLRGFIRRHPEAGWFILGCTLMHFFGYAKWWAWHGDWHWGPRFLLPVVPLMSLPLLDAPDLWRAEAERGPRRRRAAACAALLAASLYVQIIAVASTHIHYYYTLYARTRIERQYDVRQFPVTDDLWMSHFIPSLSPLIYHHRLLMRRIGLAGEEDVPWRFQEYHYWSVELPVLPWEFWWVATEEIPDHEIPARDPDRRPVPFMIAAALAGAVLLAFGLKKSAPLNHDDRVAGASAPVPPQGSP